MPWPPWAREHKLKLSYLCCFTQGAKAKNNGSFTLVKFVGDNASDNTCDSNKLLLGLATLGSMTKIEMILSVLHRPRLPRQVNSCHCRMSLALGLLHILCQWKHGLP
jgi:hypothetical protein